MTLHENPGFSEYDDSVYRGPKKSGEEVDPTKFIDANNEDPQKGKPDLSREEQSRRFAKIALEESAAIKRDPPLDLDSPEIASVFGIESKPSISPESTIAQTKKTEIPGDSMNA